MTKTLKSLVALKKIRQIHTHTHTHTHIELQKRYYNEWQRQAEESCKGGKV